MKKQANLGAVMVVDDIPDVHVAVSRVLQRAGYTVICASSGEECISFLSKGFRGLLLMDIQMPGLDGWDTIRKMIEEDLTGGNLICMLTTRPTPGEAAEGLEAYVFDYLPKPFEASRLLEVAQLASDYLRPPPGPSGAA
jgi:CheY-like chemotaxis protein